MNDDHEAIISYLTRPREEPRSVRRSGHGRVAVRVGGHVPVRPNKIRFLRELFVDDRGLLAVDYEDEDGQSWSMVLGIARTDADDWRVTGLAGGSQGEPRSSLPWANLCGWWNDRIAWIGGRVHGADIRMVRLVAADGRASEDDIGGSGIALILIVGPFTQPWTVELYDRSGGLVRSHPFEGGRPS